jgi:hypothetical protein
MAQNVTAAQYKTLAEIAKKEGAEFRTFAPVGDKPAEVQQISLNRRGLFIVAHASGKQARMVRFKNERDLDAALKKVGFDPANLPPGLGGETAGTDDQTAEALAAVSEGQKVAGVGSDGEPATASNKD